MSKKRYHLLIVISLLLLLALGTITFASHTVRHTKDQVVKEKWRNNLRAGSNLLSGAQTASPTLGEKRVLVLLIEFLDSPARPFPKEKVTEIFTREINPYFRENSYGKLSFQANVLDWLTLNKNYRKDAQGDCDRTYSLDQEQEIKNILLANNGNDYYGVVFLVNHDCSPGLGIPRRLAENQPIRKVFLPVSSLYGRPVLEDYYLQEREIRRRYGQPTDFFAFSNLGYSLSHEL